MATTKNHKITETLKKAIDYAIGDKREDKLKDDIKDSVAYVINDKTGQVIYPTIHSTLNCGTGHPYRTFSEIIKQYGTLEIENGSKRTKDGAPVLAWHYHQNFEGHVNPIVANEIGNKLAQEIFGNFSVVVGTHTNTENTHNHIIVCAWDLDGKKWNQCNAAYRHVREVSDRLCEEYGLRTLDSTKKQKLIKYKDSDGKIHYYEPTDRKNNLIRRRDSGEISSDDVGSYRNTVPYNMTVEKRETNREIIRKDIDRFIPVANSYEHLLEMLRGIGYTIKDKKKNGDWLEHIYFKPPTVERGARDYKITDDNFYIRENLECVIAQFVEDRHQEPEVEIKSEEKEKVPYFTEYKYGEVDLNSIDLNYRTVKKPDGKYDVVKRAETEKAVITDIKRADRELHGLIDTTQLEEIINQKSIKNHSVSREQKLIQQIQESFDNLSFMERENLYSYTQINAVVQGLWEQYNNCLESIEKMELIVKHLDTVIGVPYNAEIIEARIERMKDNVDYQENELNGDLAQLSAYRDTIKKYKLNDPGSVKTLAEKVEQSKLKIQKLQSALYAYSGKLTEYDRCVATLDRIDRDSGVRSEEVEVYERIKNQGEKEAKEKQENRDKRKAAER